MSGSRGVKLLWQALGVGWAPVPGMLVGWCMWGGRRGEGVDVLAAGKHRSAGCPDGSCQLSMG